MLNKGTLVLEGVTLAQVVELVVEVLVDLASGAVLDEQAAEDTQTTHPHDLTVSNVSAYCFRIYAIAVSIASPRQCNISLPLSTHPNPPLPFKAQVHTYVGILASAVPFLLPKPR